MIELENPFFFFLLLLLPLIWYWYQQRGYPQRPVTALWLINKKQKQSRFRVSRRLDLRLFSLLVSSLAVILALTGPQLRIARSSEIIIIIDASASMAARDYNGGSRIKAAKERVLKLLSKANKAVLVRAGLEPTAIGPDSGKTLVTELKKIQAGDSTTNLQKAVILGRELLPNAPILIVSDAAPPEKSDGYLNVAGNGQNTGITALGPGFAVVFNAGPASWRGSIYSETESRDLQIPPGRYAVVHFAKQTATRRARINGSDVLALDDLAFYIRSPTIVDLRISNPSLERALLAIGARLGSRAPQAIVITATPPEQPGLVQTAYFARAYGAITIAADADSTDPLTRGVNLAGLSFHRPTPPPGIGWLVLARDGSGYPLIWRRGNSLYLPPVIDWENQPALVVLFYNWLSPLQNKAHPLGTNGVLHPILRGGSAYSLLNAAETNLPRPRADQHNWRNEAYPLSGWLAIFAALFLLLANWLKVPVENS